MAVQQPQTTIDLWDTDPKTFVAQEAVKRQDLSQCHLTDDATMKLLVNKHGGASPSYIDRRRRLRRLQGVTQSPTAKGEAATTPNDSESHSATALR